MTIPLSAQASAVELAAANLRGHCSNLAELIRRGRRPQTDLDLAGTSLPALQAAAVTMRWFVKHEQRLRDFCRSIETGPAGTPPPDKDDAS